jgi:hypothetical protein
MTNTKPKTAKKPGNSMFIYYFIIIKDSREIDREATCEPSLKDGDREVSSVTAGRPPPPRDIGIPASKSISYSDHSLYTTEFSVFHSLPEFPFHQENQEFVFFCSFNFSERERG